MGQYDKAAKSGEKVRRKLDPVTAQEASEASNGLGSIMAEK